MRHLLFALSFALAFAAARSATADTLPSKKQALAAVKAWRTAVIDVPCDRPVAGGPFVCSGAGLKATMPQMVSFGMIGDTDSNVICTDDDGSKKWDGKKGFHVIEVTADYNQLSGCLSGMLEINQEAPLSVKSFSAVSKFLSKAARKELKALTKTHRFVRMKLAPSGPDDYSHYDVILAVTLNDDGTARISAVFAKLLMGDPGGE
jgi:hypothetical protein